ncbi:MAG: lipoprotein-releasing system transmembrane subunit LolC [Thalassolituus sp.]|uniref:Lipoprotein-releasing ABC transporter permease subunit n=1 Tax=Thalassolituus maritimus TaxID=484498 RepID=A0ABP9ZZF7_9GAMM|nr:lipoprotein-releasing ABC transporter permease subunit [Pseudomonadota bacterium]MEC8102395.1 lipoprotein-releasing ABC transporter permease subunit [Pseudomonadota bacterium]MEC8523746.1 lipoprotein-releasing ABC transporter permease subunit [Pseudomonadota bacterium]TNC85423.1 MAG: lipoprotein-releasing system transmembrane subunit LolC [Thalassolituus sp.]
MRANIPLWIGLRYLSAKRRNHFISFISMSSMIGMTLGVAVLILVLSVMNGFDRELRERILGMVPHAVLYKYGGIDDWEVLATRVEGLPGVAAAAPLTRLQGMLGYGGRVQGVMITGIEPEVEERVSILPQHMKEGELSSLQAGEFGVVIGELLARHLKVGLGDKITMMLPEATLSPAGVLPRIKRVTVTGIFSVGAELDSNLAVINIEDARKLGRIDAEVQSLRIRFDDLFDAPAGIWEIVGELDGRYSGTDWTRTHGNLFQAIRMEKTMIGLLLLMIVAVAAFNIISTLIMVVTDKQADIAILRTMGATPRTIMGIFMVQGLSIGVVGVLLGTTLGIIGALTISELIAALERLFQFQILNADVYFISYLPSQLKLSDVAIVVSASLLISFFATLYPSYRASRVQPAEALRYE